MPVCVAPCFNVDSSSRIDFTVSDNVVKDLARKSLPVDSVMLLLSQPNKKLVEIDRVLLYILLCS